MADTLIFDLSEFEILEQPFDFEEEIRKPEKSRIFTLDEQLVDFFEKSMPSRKPTKYELQQLKSMRDRIRLAYGKLITVTDTDYVIDTVRKSVNVSWIHPVYAQFNYKSYAYETEWMPFFEQARRRLPNYYPQLIEALPKPYQTTGEGRPLLKSNTYVDEKGGNAVNGLGPFISTKTIINDDGTTDIITVPIENTSDDLKSTGFYLDQRMLELPRPMIDHPFLKTIQPSYFETPNSLVDVYPNIEAIMEHAIPVTTDPYSEASKYLKLYDVKLSQISWSSWKERFPPAEQKETPTSVQDLTFERSKDDAPGEILLKVYTPWNSGVESRLWLSQQIDGGYLVSQLLLSESSSAGLLSVLPPVELPVHSYPEANPEICINLTSNFDMFLSSGLYRPIMEYDKSSKLKLQTGLKCNVIPVGSIQQEKRDSGFKDRLGWKESTKNDIKSEYDKLLRQFYVPPKLDEVVLYDKIARQIESERQKDIQVILEDNNRLSEDKAEAIELIIRDLHLENRQYFDTTNQFVICSHTLSILHGNMEDRMAFYSEWTTPVEGYRVCKYCGEEINKDSFIAVKEYDEDGHIVMEYDALPTNPTENKLTTSILQLKHIFDLNNVGENLLYIIMGFLQVIPQEEQVLPILQLIRRLTAGLKLRSQKSQSITKDKQDLVEGILGIAGSVVLLQTHLPFLIPKRSIGNKPLNISGYPRDSDDPETCNSLNSILSVLKKTFESFPASYKGNIATILRSILKSSSDLRLQSLQWIKIFSDQFKPLFENARERYTVPDFEAPTNGIVLPIEKVDNPSYMPGEFLEEEQYSECSIPKPGIILTSKRLPNLSQTIVKIQPRIVPSPNYVHVYSTYKAIEYDTLSEKEIRSNVGLGLPSIFSVLNEFVKVSDGPAFINLSSRFLSILSSTNFSPKIQQKIRTKITNIDSRQSVSLVRDISKGIFFELMNEIKGSPQAVRKINDSIKTDLTVRMTLLSEKVAEHEDFELKAKERNAFKNALRSMSDAEREITQTMVELKIADFIITNQDRERFAKEFQFEQEEEIPEDLNRPEEGYDDERDYVENGDEPITNDGNILDVDRGDYGDRAVRDYDDYTSKDMFEEDS
jgi:hypothetical protein